MHATITDDGPAEIHVFADSDLASCPHTAKSTSGIIVQLSRDRVAFLSCGRARNNRPSQDPRQKLSVSLWPRPSTATC